jgi:hypothetical protein
MHDAITNEWPLRRNIKTSDTGLETQLTPFYNLAVAAGDRLNRAPQPQ